MKQNLKIAILFGKGLDGCGVQRGACEIQIWGKRHGHEVKVYSLAERKFVRAAGHKLDYTDFLCEDIPSLVPELEKFDIVYVNSWPSASNSREAIDGFLFDLLMKLKQPVILGMMGELTQMNINRIPHLLAIMNVCDIILNFGEDTYFAKTCSKQLPSKKVGERIKRFTMWLNFISDTEDLRNSIPLAAKKKELLYASRWTTMKDPKRVLDMGPALREVGIDARLIGIERSIGAKQDILDHPNAYDLTQKNKTYGDPSGVPIYGPYTRQYGLEQMAGSLFNCSFYRMPKDPQGYGDRMEYAQMEMIAVGSLPVFDLHWAENNRIKTGERFVDIPHSGIYSDRANLAETVDQLQRIANSPEIQQKIRETSYDIIRSEYDADQVLSNLFEMVLDTGKDQQKFKSVDEMLLSITGSDEYVDCYNELKNQGELVALGLNEVVNGVLATFDGKKRTEVMTIKLPKIRATQKKASVLEF